MTVFGFRKTRTRKTKPFIQNYTIENTVFHRFESSRDLGVIFDAKFSFVKHIVVFILIKKVTFYTEDSA